MICECITITRNCHNIYRPATSLIIYHYKIHIFKYSHVPSIFWPQKAFIKRFVCCCSIRSMYWVQKTFILNGKMVIAFIKKGRLLLVSMRTITALSYKRCIHRRPYFSPLQFSLSKMKTDFLILYHIRISIQVRVDDRITINVTNS